jgi:hypothetical protein
MAKVKTSQRTRPKARGKRPARSKNPLPSKLDRAVEPAENSISEEMIDKTLEDSFPASDPPSWMTGREHSDAHSTENTGASQKKTRRKSG